MKKKDQFIYVAEIEKTLYQRQFYKKNPTEIRYLL